MATVNFETGTVIPSTWLNEVDQVVHDTDGADYVSFTPAGSGATVRSVQTKLRDIISVKDFGALGDGSNDDTAEFQAAVTAAGTNGALYIPEGTYLLSATITLPEGIKIRGEGPQSTILYRTGDYGDTFVCGTTDTSAPARSLEVTGITFKHSIPFSSGDTTLVNRATSGAHILIRGAQNCTISNCWFWRLPYNLRFVGGTLVTITNCQFLGTWDPDRVALQEGIASILLAYDATHGNPTTYVIEGNKFFGATVTRDVTYSPSSGAVIVNCVDTIGTMYGIYVTGLEDLTMSDNYFGGQSIAQFAVINASGSSVIDLRITSNFFDGISRGEAILFAPTVANLFSLAVTISSNIFTDNLFSVFVNLNAGSTTPAVYGLGINDNDFMAGRGTPVYLNGASGFTVASNRIVNYNVFALTTVDKQYCSGVYTTGVSAKGLLSDNVVGGGGNTLLNTTGTNYCYFGLPVDTALPDVLVTDNYYIGVRVGTTFFTGLAPTENVYTLTAAGNYQMLTKDAVVIVNKTVGAATTVILPANPVTFRRALIKDGKGDAAANNLTCQTSDSTTIDGGATVVLSSNYTYAEFLFNGTQWNRIG